MARVPNPQVEDQIAREDIWDDDLTAWWEDDRRDYWDGIHSGEMSWQWYMKLSQYKDWHTVIINKAHKNVTVANWILSEYFGECGFEYEREHFIIEDASVAMMVALKWT